MDQMTLLTNLNTIQIRFNDKLLNATIEPVTVCTNELVIFHLNDGKAITELL